MPRDYRATRSLYVFFATFCAIILLILGINGVADPFDKADFLSPKRGHPSWQTKPLPKARATAGDEYLIGVGKADITG